ncbi:MAG: MBOAT family protein [Clostridiales Family XIII bacterium]|jgi:alginate O-acetyltransferase complex protein AlgI|nr:MBOAT family protein [Clostridiales Family XIII bacterium]
MIFSSAVFLFVFLPLCLAGYYLIRPLRFKNLFLMIMSLLFYGFGEPRFVYLMILSVFINWCFGLAVDRFRASKRIARAFLAGMVCWNAGLFFVYKYLNFTIAALDRFFGLDAEPTSFALPIGISFFTFQAMSYVFDVYRGSAGAQKNPLNVLLYISLFPQLVAGPIVRYETIAGQLTDRKASWDDFSCGVRRFIIGLGKKLILANAVAVVADRAFGAQAADAPTVLTAWLGVVCYTLQIYFDFSGYSDMAIGLGRMFGFRFAENFNYPYISRTVTEFWRRWHISLSGWFRDYVYIPLGGSRVRAKLRLVFNLFVVWMLTGIWHGAGLTFVLWGFLYFVLLAFEKLCDIPVRIERVRGTRFAFAGVFYRIFTILCFMCAWVIFRAAGPSAALRYFEAMFGVLPGGLPLYDAQSLFYLQDNLIILAIAAFACTPVLQAVMARAAASASPLRAEKALCALSDIFLAAVFLVCVSYTVNGSYNPFIYFNF